MAWSAQEERALLEILHDRTRWPLLECKGEGADAVFDDVQVRSLGGVAEHACADELACITRAGACVQRQARGA